MSERVYPEGSVAWDEAWRQRQRADTLEKENAKLRERVAELERELESSYDPITDEQVDKLILSATKNAEERSKHFREFLEWATKEVASWPEWKRNVLGNSMKAQNDTPRKPVVND